MAVGKRLKNPHPSKYVLIVECAFCKGTGKDPFNLLSTLAECQVCVGRCVVTIPEAAIECAFCKGTGVYPGKRLTCITCGGKGRAGVAEPFEICRKCNGLGASPNENLPCVDCGGTGVVKTVEL